MSDILFGPIGSLYFSTIKLFSELGLNVIVDTVISDDKFFNDFMICLRIIRYCLLVFIAPKKNLPEESKAGGSRDRACSFPVRLHLRLR